MTAVVAVLAVLGVVLEAMAVREATAGASDSQRSLSVHCTKTSHKLHTPSYLCCTWR